MNTERPVDTLPDMGKFEIEHLIPRAQGRERRGVEFVDFL